MPCVVLCLQPKLPSTAAFTTWRNKWLRREEGEGGIEAFSRGKVSSKMFSFTNPEKSFQTYCLTSPHPLTRERARQQINYMAYKEF